MTEPSTRANLWLLNAYWFGVSFMWNSIHPIILPVVLLTLVSEGTKNTVYGLLTFVGLILALLTTPITGALSDHTRHSLGRRRPWIIAGACLCAVVLFGLARAPALWGVSLGYLLLQISSNVAHGPAQGLIPDLVLPGQRGVASGIKTAVDMAGIIAAAVVMGRLMGGAAPHTTLAVTLLAGTLLASMSLTVWGVREAPATPSADQGAERLTMADLAARVRRALAVDWRGHRGYARLLGARYLVLLGSYLVQSFALYYLRDVIGAPDPARSMGNLMAVIAISITLVAYPAGALSERVGRRPLSLVACGIAAAGMSLLCVTRNMTGLFFLGAFIGLGMGAFASVNWAWATDLVPKAEAAKYLGLTNLATAGSAATARLVGPLIDLVNRLAPSAGYLSVFALAAVAALGGLLMTLRIADGQAGGGPKPTACAIRWEIRMPWRSGHR